MKRLADTIVSIHGQWLTPPFWEHRADHYQRKGFTVLAPGYLGIEPGEAGNDHRPPLLFISGSRDHILPPPVQRENYDKNVEHSTAVTAYQLFTDRDHCTCGADGWKSVADLALTWALNPQPGELSRAR